MPPLAALATFGVGLPCDDEDWPRCWIAPVLLTHGSQHAKQCEKELEMVTGNHL